MHRLFKPWRNVMCPPESAVSTRHTDWQTGTSQFYGYKSVVGLAKGSVTFDFTVNVCPPERIFVNLPDRMPFLLSAAAILISVLMVIADAKSPIIIGMRGVHLCLFLKNVFC